MKIKVTTALKLLSIIGVPVTAFISAKNHEKCLEEINKFKLEKGTELETAEVLKIIARTHWSTFVSGAVTIASQAGAYHLDAKTIAGLVGVISAGGYAANEYKAQLKKLLGKEKYDELEKKIKEAVSLEHIKKDPPKLEEADRKLLAENAQNDGRTLYFDFLSKSWLRTTRETILSAALNMNHSIQAKGEYYCKDWVKDLGITAPVRDFADDEGWNNDLLMEYYGAEEIWIDVVTVEKELEDGTKYEVIYTCYDPVCLEAYEEELYSEDDIK